MHEDIFFRVTPVDETVSAFDIEPLDSPGDLVGEDRLLSSYSLGLFGLLFRVSHDVLDGGKGVDTPRCSPSSLQLG